MLTVVNHSNVLSRITERMLCGLEVDNDDWALLQFSVGELDTLLRRRVIVPSVSQRDLALPSGSDDGLSTDEDIPSNSDGTNRRASIFGARGGSRRGAIFGGGGGRRRSLFS